MQAVSSRISFCARGRLPPISCAPIRVGAETEAKITVKIKIYKAIC